MITFGAKLKFLSESCLQRRAQKSAREASSRAKDAARAKREQKKFVVTFYNGRKLDVHDWEAHDARVQRELLQERAAAAAPDDESRKEGLASHPKPFRVAGVPVIKGSDLRQIAARDEVLYIQGLPSEEESAKPPDDLKKGRRIEKEWCSLPSRPQPRGDALVAAKEATEIRTEVGKHPEPLQAQRPREPKWVHSFRRGPDQFELRCQAATAEKEHEIRVATEAARVYEEPFVTASPPPPRRRRAKSNTTCINALT
ncbi:hypothetical protein CTAYLR_001084 [Chrysophaeum taylorii]|uniref:Uncharacterized protein n=1 Tax=Chrysophaeum taylorii TaxID=2483200 RepID=A0AAD7UFJ2_9STRA|nr:hypothetical protein CTAYLR_001084 [Chrysophaeum taylorii]